MISSRKREPCGSVRPTPGNVLGEERKQTLSLPALPDLAGSSSLLDDKLTKPKSLTKRQYPIRRERLHWLMNVEYPFPKKTLTDILCYILFLFSCHFEVVLV